MVNEGVEEDEARWAREWLGERGLQLEAAPDPHLLRTEPAALATRLARDLRCGPEGARASDRLLAYLRRACEPTTSFRHLVLPHVTRLDPESPGTPRALADCALKLLLAAGPLQDDLADLVFERATDLAVEGTCAPWIKNVLRCFSTLDIVISPDRMAKRLIDLLDVSVERAVRLEVVLAIPDIIGDGEHEDVSSELSRFLSEDPELTPAILDCLSYLCLSDHRYDELQKKAIGILRTSMQFEYFPNFVKFLLAPGRTNEAGFSETVRELRSALSWPIEGTDEISTSQVLTAMALRNSMTASKVIAGTWLKCMLSCKETIDHKPIDFVVLLLLYTTSDERQRVVENLIRKHIKCNILSEELLEEAFQNFKPIFKNHLQSMMELVTSLLKLKSDNLVVSFATHWYITMFRELEDSRQTIIAELLQHGLSNKHSVNSMLLILKDIAANDIALLKPQSLQMLPLLDRMDDLNLGEIREIMNILSGLAYSFDNSVLRDDIHMIITKQLGSSDLAVKVKGIIASVQAVKYLTRHKESGDNNAERSENISYSSHDHLADGPIKEAAQMIELISKSIRQLPDLIGLFYDELTEVISSASYINSSFVWYLADAVTNDLEQNFIVNELTFEKINDIDVSIQYGLNAEEELTDFIAISIAGMSQSVTTNADCADISILPSLFQLVQTVHLRKDNGDLSGIDALLGCPVIMPNFDPEDCTDGLEQDKVFIILDWLIHCANWFRELINAFSTQTDVQLKQKVMKRIEHIEEIEHTINKILININGTYKPPVCMIDLSKYFGEYTDRKVVLKRVSSKTKLNKRPKLDDTTIPVTSKSQGTQINVNHSNIKSKLGMLEKIPFRNLHLNVMVLLNQDLLTEPDGNGTLSLNSCIFLLKHINKNAAKVLVSRVIKTTFLTKEKSYVYDDKAKNTAKEIFKILPKLIVHVEDLMKSVTEVLRDDGSVEFSPHVIDLQLCLEHLFNTISTYLKWIGFRKSNHALLKSSIRAMITNPDNKSSKVMALKELLLLTATTFKKYEDICFVVPTAVALIEIIRAITDLSENSNSSKILREVSYNFLSKKWNSSEGVPEKGLIFNQYVDRVMVTYFLNPEIKALKSMVSQVKDEITKLTGNSDNLNTLKCISKANFPILYRNLTGALSEAAKNELKKGLTDSQHLELWKEVATVLKTLSEIAKILDSRNNLSAFLKKSQPTIKIFLSQGMPMLELKLKTESDSVIEVLKLFQQSTRFLQTLCCHSRLKKDTALMAKVPQIRLLLETLIYKVKAALAANKCSEAFSMGNLKNKNIQGEVIQSQVSVNDEENAEESDEQLPEDDEEASDGEDNLLNPGSKSVSDII